MIFVDNNIIVSAGTQSVLLVLQMCRLHIKNVIIWHKKPVWVLGEDKCWPPLSHSHLLFLSSCRIGTAGIAVQVVGSNWPKPHYTLLITGLCRFSLSSLLKDRPFVLAEVGHYVVLLRWRRFCVPIQQTGTVTGAPTAYSKWLSYLNLQQTCLISDNLLRTFFPHFLLIRGNTSWPWGAAVA